MSTQVPGGPACRGGEGKAGEAPGLRLSSARGTGVTEEREQGFPSHWDPGA